MAKYSLKDLLADEKPESKINTLSFEDGMALLEELVATVEAGKLPLEKAVSSYERAAVLIGQLRGQLSGAEEKLKVLFKNKKGQFEVKEAED